MPDIERMLADEWSRIEAAAWIAKLDPADDSLVARVPVSDVRAIDQAVIAARAAFGGWARVRPAHRGELLDGVAVALEAHADDLALLLTREMGQPMPSARARVDAGIATLREYARLGPLHRGRRLAGDWRATDTVTYEPRGVCAIVTPWNDPVAVACELVGAAVVTGNTVVLKPSERTPASGWLLGRLMGQALPDGVLNSVSGGPDVGARLIKRDLAVIAHAGTTAVGRRIDRIAAMTGAKTILRNSGNDPLVVDQDVDPVWAAEQAALGAYANSGQVSDAVERIYVCRSVAAPFIAALCSIAAEAKLAPLVDRELRDHVHAQVVSANRQGARTAVGGEVPDGPGAYYPATVLTGCSDHMVVMREETFGPVAPVAVVDSFDQALESAARGTYGLAANVLTASMAHAQRACRELPAGTVKVNNVHGGAPGGTAHPRRSSGHGYGYGPELLDEFTVAKVTHVEPPGMRASGGDESLR